MKRMVQRLVMFSVAVGVLAACNTMAGLGKDVEKVGGKIEKKAEEKKSY
jgi:entericidin A